MLLLCLIIHYNIYTSNNGIHVTGNDNTSTHRVMKEEDHIPCQDGSGNGPDTT